MVLGGNYEGNKIIKKLVPLLGSFVNCVRLSSIYSVF